MGVDLLKHNKSHEELSQLSGRKSKRHSSTHSHRSHFSSRSTKSHGKRKKKVKIDSGIPEEVHYRNNAMITGGNIANMKFDLS